LYLGLAALLSLAGHDADRLLVLVCILSFVALTWGSYELASRLFGEWPAAAAALFVGSSFAFALYAVRAYVDIPFLAVVVWAAALEAQAPRRRLAVPVLLAVAGLLRPEAWILSGLCLLWHWDRASRRRRVTLVTLVALAPLAWSVVDLAVTGNPLFSLTSTSALAENLGRERGLGAVPGSFFSFLADVARPPVAGAGVLGLVLAVGRWDPRRMAPLLALVGAGAVTFVGTGIAGLSILPRYLTVPAVGLCVAAGYAVLGFTTVPVGPTRELWRRFAIFAGIVGAVFLVAKASSFGRLRAELRFIDATHKDVAALLDEPALRAGLRCGPLTFPTYRLVPDARWQLHAPASEVSTRAVGDPERGVAVYIVGDGKAERRFGHADGVSRRTDVPPPGPPTVRRGAYVAYVRC
jgi:hypothetical protein